MHVAQSRPTMELSKDSHGWECMGMVTVDFVVDSIGSKRNHQMWTGLCQFARTTGLFSTSANCVVWCIYLIIRFVFSIDHYGSHTNLMFVVHEVRLK